MGLLAITPVEGQIVAVAGPKIAVQAGSTPELH